MRSLFFLALVICITSGAQSFGDEDERYRQIKQWVQQLGDDSFVVRQRAESLLIRAGFYAYSELQRAKQSRDAEIVRRAEYVLSQIEQNFLNTESRATVQWVQYYMRAPNKVIKARIIWFLADPTSDLSKGEGLQTLCRLLRFEESAALRLEAAKALIASPPLSPMHRQKWYRHIRDITQEPGNEELLQFLSRYAKLWCDLDDADEKTTEAFQEQVRQVGAATLQLLKRPENNVQTGSAIDILLHYAVAELYDTVGITDDRDKVHAAALTVQPDELQTSELQVRDMVLFFQNDGLLMNEHFQVGCYLLGRFRLHGALAHFQKVIELGDINLRVEASKLVADIVADYLADWSAAAGLYDKHIEILQSPENKANNDPTQRVARAQRQKAYCLARKAEAEENWDAVREHVLQALAIPNLLIDDKDIGLAILIHRLCKQQPDLDREFLDKAEPVPKQVWHSVVQDFESVHYEMRLEKMSHTCHTAAWLLANTDGDYPSALEFIEMALKTDPDDINILDTLAHVYFCGGKIEEAVRTQEQVVRLAPEAVVYRQALERFKRAKEE
jgi:tetratricopeptide (TPR) repeat protein